MGCIDINQDQMQEFYEKCNNQCETGWTMISRVKWWNFEKRGIILLATKEPDLSGLPHVAPKEPNHQGAEKLPTNTPNTLGA